MELISIWPRALVFCAGDGALAALVAVGIIPWEIFALGNVLATVATLALSKTRNQKSNPGLMFVL